MVESPGHLIREAPQRDFAGPLNPRLAVFLTHHRKNGMGREMGDPSEAPRFAQCEAAAPGRALDRDQGVGLEVAEEDDQGNAAEQVRHPARGGRAPGHRRGDQHAGV